MIAIGVWFFPVQGTALVNFIPTLIDRWKPIVFMEGLGKPVGVMTVLGALSSLSLLSSFRPFDRSLLAAHGLIAFFWSLFSSLSFVDSQQLFIDLLAFFSTAMITLWALWSFLRIGQSKGTTATSSSAVEPTLNFTSPAAETKSSETKPESGHEPIP